MEKIMRYQERISDLQSEIRKLNNQSEYIRLKYFGVMKYKCNLITYYQSEIESINRDFTNFSYNTLLWSR